jgi:hypothetical protein
VRPAGARGLAVEEQRARPAGAQQLAGLDVEHVTVLGRNGHAAQLALLVRFGERALGPALRQRSQSG